jgi:hypothetical protein
MNTKFLCVLFVLDCEIRVGAIKQHSLLFFARIPHALKGMGMISRDTTAFKL